MAEGPRRRLRLVGIVLIGLVLVLVAQLIQVQIINHGFYAAWAQEQQRLPVIIVEPPRGVIRGRNGHLLAGNSVMYSVEADTHYVWDVEATATGLGLLLHTPAAEVGSALLSGDSNDPWIVIGQPVSKQVGEEVAAQGLRGIAARSLWIREYPEGQFASHLLGFCNAEDKCFYGVEGFYDTILRPLEYSLRSFHLLGKQRVAAAPSTVGPLSRIIVVTTTGSSHSNTTVSQEPTPSRIALRTKTVSCPYPTPICGVRPASIARDSVNTRLDVNWHPDCLCSKALAKRGDLQ
jgi:hypothetical protein